MAETQIVQVFFEGNISSDLFFKFSDDTGILSTGSCSGTDRMVFNVELGSSTDKEYHLRIEDGDGALVSAKKRDSVGGIVIVDNVDIGNPVTRKKPEAFANQDQMNTQFKL